jgi:predicted small lipoprotein YifL
VRVQQVQHSRLFARLAVFGVLACALGLAACGRKGGLDPPPSAMTNEPVVQGTGPDQAPGVAQPGYAPDGRPVTPQGVKKRLPMDVILD